MGTPPSTLPSAVSATFKRRKPDSCRQSARVPPATRRGFVANGIGQIWRGTQAGEEYVSSASRLKRSLQAAVLATACPVLFAGVAAAPASAAGGLRPAVTAGTWGKAEEVPGIEALNHGLSSIDQMSCPSAGNCSAGGTYTDATGAEQFFVVNETNGVWGNATQLTGATVHNLNGLSFVEAMSCASAGNCSTAVIFEPFNGKERVWVATETSGVWGNAIPVPGLDRLEGGGEASIRGLSCKAPGDCSAGGYYVDSGRIFRPFLVSETNGRWHTAIKVPGFAALGQLNTGEIEALSCDSPGSCSAGGTYQVGNSLKLFTIAEKAGKWQKAVKVPGNSSLKTDGSIDFTQMSCPSAGKCGAVGHFGDNARAFVATETAGTWGAVQAVRGISVTAEGFSDLTGVSCTSAGDCLAVGTWATVTGDTQHLFTVFERNGTWDSAKPVPGFARLNAGVLVEAGGVSCGAPGDCSVAGGYSDHSNHEQAFVASEVNGRWVTPVQEVPGSAVLNAGGTAITWAVSCGAAGNCGAGGTFTQPFGKQDPFVVNQP